MPSPRSLPARPGQPRRPPLPLAPCVALLPSCLAVLCLPGYLWQRCLAVRYARLRPRTRNFGRRGLLGRSYSGSVATGSPVCVQPCYLLHDVMPLYLSVSLSLSDSLSPSLSLSLSLHMACKYQYALLYIYACSAVGGSEGRAGAHRNALHAYIICMYVYCILRWGVGGEGRTGTRETPDSDRARTCGGGVCRCLGAGASDVAGGP